MTNDDCISRKAVLNIIDSYSNSQSNVEDVTQDCISDIMALPSVQPKAKTGHWIKRPHGFKCSKCLIVHSQTSIFCPSCGVKMIEPQESEKV